MNSSRWPYVLVNLAALIWATNFILGRAVRADVGAVTLNTMRFSVAGVLFAVLWWRQAAPRPAFTRREWLLLVGMAFTGVLGFNSLLYTGLKLTTALNAALINGSAPLIITLMAVVMLAERPTPRFWVGVVISLVGLGIVITQGQWQTLAALQFNWGDALVLLAVAGWGLYSVWGRILMHRHSTVAVTALSIWLGLPMLYPLAAWELVTQPMTWSWPVVLAALYIGVGPAFVAYWAWNEGVRQLGPARATLFYNMSPVYVAVLSLLLLGEPLTAPQLIGGALVLGGSVFSVFSSPK